MEKTDKEKALDKLKLEIKKDILRILELSKNCGMGELFYFLHYLHIIRLLNFSPNKKDEDDKIISVYRNHFTDSYKYLIQVLHKFSKREFNENNLIDPNIPIVLNDIVLSMNSKYENLSFITLFSDIQVSGERDRYFRIDMSNILEDETLYKYFQYSFRVNRANDFDRDDLKAKNNFLEKFKANYLPFGDIFELEFKISLDEFIQLINYILDKVIAQLNQDELIKLENGKVDVQALGTILAFGKAMIINKVDLFDHFGVKIEHILSRLSFNLDEFDIEQLRYNLIARQPLLDYGKQIIVSPELLLDSIFINSHYSLLEAGEHKEEYKKRDSDFFVDKLADKAAKYGYSEVERERELYDGKKQIGDIDLILKNSNNHFLLIEAKNHSIPLDVYFHDFQAMEKRLEYLKNEWEKKVNRRIDHLKTKSLNYDIPSNHTYVIVSKSPEILSHFSEILVLSEFEFDYWLKQDNIDSSFDLLFQDLYNMEQQRFTVEQLEQIQKDLNTGTTFKKE
ncbi:hypothetical protein SD960_20925 [Flavobacterium sp. MMLR14_040]|uniref:hypothetical protein n=1 Tax=Flavobacterium sp. MMLR14_040 TaxID=3093843 RepID=UPI00298F6EFA|nr:hypothetical protein [Flavobacterium sp. MMLR14_040]MDW8852578.1 hypothetical protein [Flavobacterium sp. MMLR14_040]